MDRGMSTSWPTFIRKRDGRLVPFEADRVTQTLFALTERLDQPDAFLARELTDSILHFLREQESDQSLSTQQLMGWMQHVLRELGQQRLATELGRYASEQSSKQTEMAASPKPTDNGVRPWFPLTPQAHHPTDWSAMRQQHPDLVSRMTLERVFSRHLQSAHAEGLLELHDLDCPIELISHVHRLTPGWGALEWLQALRRFVGKTIILDAFEEDLLLAGHSESSAATWLDELVWACHLTGLHIVLHLNVGHPPLWAESARGPLFQRATQKLLFDDERYHLRQTVLDRIARQPEAWPYVQIAWHVPVVENGIEQPWPAEWMYLARLAIQGLPLRLIFERPKCSIPLSDGVDRRWPTRLQHVSLRLDRLWQRQRQALSPTAFTGKVLSLARMSVSAGPCKRERLRQLPAYDRPPFWIDKAHVHLTLTGMEQLLELQGVPCSERASARTAWMQTLARRLIPAMAEESRFASMPIWIEAEASGSTLTLARPAWKELGREQSCWGKGCVKLQLEGYDPPDLVELWHYLQRQTGISSVLTKRRSSLTKTGPNP